MNFNSSIYPVQGIDVYNNITISLTQHSGRNAFSVVQQPTRANGYQAIFHMYDPQNNANNYSFTTYIVAVS